MINTNFQPSIKSPYWTKTTGLSLEANVVQENYLKAIEHFTHTITTETTEQKFARLTSNWKRDFQLSSSSVPLLMNPSYLGIVAMGEKVLPLIFSDLQQSPDHWFMALSVLTGANPVAPDNRGNVSAMTEDWLLWAKRRGYVA